MTEEQNQKAIRLYKNKNLRYGEIANLMGISVPSLTLIIHKAMLEGKVEPRRKGIALKPRTPNGQGKKIVKKGVGSGNYFHKSKFSPEDEVEIMRDYYEKDLSTSQLKKKWNIFPKQLQRLREKFRDSYTIKANAPYVYQYKYSMKEGNYGDNRTEDGRTEDLRD